MMVNYIDEAMDRIKPVLRLIITDIIAPSREHFIHYRAMCPNFLTLQETDKAERISTEEQDEQELGDIVRPLIEEGSRILQETNVSIRALDSSGRIAAGVKQKAASRDATPDEYRLAEKLKDLSENVSKTIEPAKQKTAGMPHAKKELNPLWGLLTEPLGQILAAGRLLLSDVLGLVGRLCA
jgi:hypothetical protein